MPTYEYRCSECEHTFEAFQSMSAAPLTLCPKCSEPALKRLIGPGAGFIFKGSGFYVTDYTRSKDYKEKAKAETGAGTASGTGTGTGTGTGSGSAGNGTGKQGGAEAGSKESAPKATDSGKAS